jgi:chromosomal replication initiator protein
MNTVHYYAIPGLIRGGGKQHVNISPEEIISLVCKNLNVSFEQLSGPRGRTDIVVSRYILCHFLYKYTIMNKSDIGKKLNRDHTTIMYGLKEVQAWIETDEKIRNTVDKLRALFEF